MNAISISLALTLLAAGMSGDAQPLPVETYVNRDGEAEALADIALGHPARIYYHSMCGDRCILRGVGIANCEPERFDTQDAPDGFFISIPEAAMKIDPFETTEQRDRRSSAIFFAKTYNAKMFRELKTDIMKHCPQAELTR